MVFLTKPNGNSSSGNNVRYALKRLYVNNQVDLNAAKREIQIAVSAWYNLIIDLQQLYDKSTTIFAMMSIIVYNIYIYGTVALWNKRLCFFFVILQSNLSGHKNIIGYIDSSITTHPGELEFKYKTIKFIEMCNIFLYFLKVVCLKC